LRFRVLARLSASGNGCPPLGTKRANTRMGNKKRFQVTLRHSVPPGRHARPENGFWRRRTVTPLLPVAAFGRLGSTLRRPPASHLQLSRHLETAFRSPNSGCPFPGHLCRINVSGLLLSCRAGSSTGPFGSGLPSSPRLPDAGWISTRLPLPALRPALSAAPRASAPGRDLPIPPAHRSSRFTVQKPASAERPMPFAPRQRQFFMTAPNGSKFQVRSVPPGSLFRGPLGTSTILHRIDFRVKRKMEFPTVFPPSFSALKSMGYGRQVLKTCG
jgi:hypothetical protein